MRKIEAEQTIICLHDHLGLSEGESVDTHHVDSLVGKEINCVTQLYHVRRDCFER